MQGCDALSSVKFEKRLDGDCHHIKIGRQSYAEHTQIRCFNMHDKITSLYFKRLGNFVRLELFVYFHAIFYDACLSLRRKPDSDDAPERMSGSGLRGIHVESGSTSRIGEKGSVFLAATGKVRKGAGAAVGPSRLPLLWGRTSLPKVHERSSLPPPPLTRDSVSALGVDKVVTFPNSEFSV